MFITYGTLKLGMADRLPGLFHVVTEFAHFDYVPLIPLGSVLVFERTIDQFALKRRGWDSCPTESLPAGPIEQHVLEQLNSLSKVEQPNESALTAPLSAELRVAWKILKSRGGSLNSKQAWLLLDQLVDRAEYHGGTNEMSITFRSEPLCAMHNNH
jgi:hypothetical protein